MGKRDPRFDAYIGKSADFAQPVLKHLRELMHDACPDVEETIKWGMPFYVYQGPLANMASFKQHCAFGFWKGALLIKDNPKAQEAMGSFGRLTKVADLPAKKQLVSYVRAAMKLNEDGVKSPARSKPARKNEPKIPAGLAAALKKNTPARKGYEAFSPSHKREYIEWLTEAKTPETRERRLATALEQMAQGKSRHWKYAKK
jgi:uncharacterized protein YdeI (YjbR/CyaY-like superfamily)